MTEEQNPMGASSVQAGRNPVNRAAERARTKPLTDFAFFQRFRSFFIFLCPDVMQWTVFFSNSTVRN